MQITPAIALPGSVTLVNSYKRSITLNAQEMREVARYVRERKE